MRRWWRWILLGLVVVTAALLGAAGLMVQHIPQWYRPIAVAPDKLQQVKDDLLATFDGFSTSLIQVTEPFECRFTQDQINAWLIAREEIWPFSPQWLPPSLSDPFVTIDPSGIRLAAVYQRSGLKTVLSVQLEAGAHRQGLIMRLNEVSAGSLGIPESWVIQELVALEEAGVWPSGQRSKYQYGQHPLPALSRLFKGIVLPNAWVWQNGKQPFRITALRLEPGALVITVEPLSR